MKKYSQIIILAEDTMQNAFVHGFRNAAKFEKNRVRDTLLPLNERQSGGNAWVEQQFVSQVEMVYNRCCAKRTATLLIVVYDADDKLVRNVQLDFDNKVNSDLHDCYAVLIPKRNIESWVYYYVNKTPYDETLDLHHPYNGKLSRQAGAEIFEYIQNGKYDLNQLPPSMRDCWQAFLKIKDGL